MAKSKKYHHVRDRISELPDELLVSILSLISFKEAVRTSALSHRWEKVWTFYSGLDFDGSKTLFDIGYQIKEFCTDSKKINEVLDIERGRYVNWVNHIVESSNAGAIDVFRVRFDLHERYRGDIDKWVRFAFENKVKNFELNLSCYQKLFYSSDQYYPLCSQALPSPSSISLTSLILKNVNVSEEVLEKLISNSPLLESLCVGGSISIVRLRVVGPSLRLKYVEISCCKKLRSLQLDAVNLLSLKYFGARDIPFRSIPNLVELEILGNHFQFLVPELPQLSASFSRLHKLRLVIYDAVKKRTLMMLEDTRFTQLKELELRVYASADESLLRYSQLIKACPSLNRFALELYCHKPFHGVGGNKVKQRLPDSLKVVEVTGFVGQDVDVEFCKFLIKNAKMLEKIIINPCYLLQRGTPYENDHAETVEAARLCAESLRAKHRLGDKLVIIS